MSVQSILDAYAQATLAQAQSNVLAATRSQIASLNDALTSNYLQAFNGWLTSWNAGRVTDKSSAPLPPKGYFVGTFNDPTTGPGSLGPYGDTVVQWTYPAVGNTPICAQPAIPDMPAAQSQPVMTASATKMNVPPGDTMPIGFIDVAPDGSKWQKVSSPTPFGVAVYYEKVS